MQDKAESLGGANASRGEPDCKDRLPFWVLAKEGFSLLEAAELP